MNLPCAFKSFYAFLISCSKLEGPHDCIGAAHAGDTGAQRHKISVTTNLNGLGEETLHDPNVRNSLEIAGSKIKVADQRWQPALTSCLKTIRSQLGLPAQLGDQPGGGDPG